MNLKSLSKHPLHFSLKLECHGGVSVQQNGGVVAYMRIGSTVICRHVHEAVTFALSWKREKEVERHDTIWKIGTITQRIFTMKGKDEVLH